MLFEEKPLAGVLNTDDNSWVLPSGHHTDARNIRFRGNAGNMRAENVLGTTLIANADLPNTGTNVCIGAFYDDVKQRVFYFNYNSGAINGMYILDVLTQTVSTLVKIGAGTDGDILGFTLTQPIYDARIMYGDDEQGDVLFWRNSQKEPCKINIDRQLAGGYGVVLRDYIKVIKAPFDTPPLAVYQDDSSVTINNMRKGVLFVAKYRPIYDDNDTGVWSAWSKVAIPVDANDLAVNADPTKNAKIGLVIETGANNVKKIEIAFAQNLGADPITNRGNAWSDFFSVAVLDKAVEGLGDNDITTYYFFNDKAYNYIDARESVELYDLVPIYADSQGLLNGTTIDYGGCTEGYAPVTSWGNTALSVTSVNNYRTVAKSVLGVIQGGNTLSSGAQDIHAIVIGAITTGDVFTIQTTNNTITYAALGGNTATDVINGLATAATGAGFTIDVQTANDLVFHKTNELLIRFLLAPITTTVLGTTDCTPIYDWASTGSLALEYFDKDGRTIGAQTIPELSFQTLEYFESAGVPKIPQLNASLYHRPPLEAWYYSWSRTKDLSKRRQRQWITDRTFKDTAASSDGNFYAYLSIENLNQYIVANPTSSFLAYDFAQGDRVRFIKSYASAVFNPSFIYSNRDYALQGQVIDPVINGVQYQGQFLKLFLPTTSITFDFGSTSTVPTLDWDNYFIELYSPALAVAEGLDRYFEFGEKYAILNPETNTRCHQGMLQNQSTNLVTPATFSFLQGDYYLRQRTITATPIFKWIIPEGDDVTNLGLIPMQLQQSFNVVGYTMQSQPSGTYVSSGDNWFGDITDGNAYTFLIRGTITVKTLNSSSSGFTIKVQALDPPVTGTTFTLATSPAPTTAGQTKTFSINTTIAVTAGYEKLWIYFFSPGDPDLQVHIVSGELTLYDTAKTFNQLMIDANFSDNYQSAVNADGRAFVVDPNAAQRHLNTLIRWGLPYQVDTNINQSNRFYAENFDELDKAKGGIKALVERGRTQRTFQERAVGVLGVYAKYIQDSNGTQTLTTTDEIITKNNVQYYEGEHGVGNHPEGIVSSAMADYFIDPVTGDQLRIAETGGIVSINRAFKGDYYIRSLLTPYNKTWARTDGSYAKILGAFDFFENQLVQVLQSGTNGGDSISNYTFSFNEKRNAYCCFNDYFPEWIVSAQDFLVSFKDGNVYVHNDATNMNTFYGVNYNSSIKLVFNKDIILHKKQLTVGYQSNQIWTSPTNGDIKTSYYNQQTGFQQISQLKSVDYSMEEGKRVAAFLRDANSGLDARLALLEGEYLEGNWLEINFKYLGISSAWIYAPYIRYILSNPNP